LTRKSVQNLAKTFRFVLCVLLTAVLTQTKKAARSLCEICGIDLPLPEQPDGDSSSSFDNIQLNEEFHALGLDSKDWISQPPPNKRRKVRSEPGLLEEITSRLSLLLGAQDVTDLTGLSQLAEYANHSQTMLLLTKFRQLYSELDDANRYSAIEYLGMIPCAASGTLTVTYDEDGAPRYSTCSICEDSKYSGPKSKQDNCEQARNDSIMVFNNIIKSQPFQDSRKPRVLAMITLRKFTSHFRTPEFIDLETSPLAHWCLKSLRSSVRELRIAAG
jgi:serine/threonine-protein kinase ATR